VYNLTLLQIPFVLIHKFSEFIICFIQVTSVTPVENSTGN
jgi:hypothetical protein